MSHVVTELVWLRTSCAVTRTNRRVDETSLAAMFSTTSRTERVAITASAASSVLLTEQSDGAVPTHTLQATSPEPTSTNGVSAQAIVTCVPTTPPTHASLSSDQEKPTTVSVASMGGSESNHNGADVTSCTAPSVLVQRSSAMMGSPSSMECASKSEEIRTTPRSTVAFAS